MAFDPGTLALGLLLGFAVHWGKSYFSAHGQEHGKQDAIAEKFDRIVEQNKAITTGQEEIKQQLGHQAFLERERWLARKQHYEDIQETLYQLWTIYRGSYAAFGRATIAAKHRGPIEILAAVSQQHQRDKEEELLETLVFKSNLARAFISDENLHVPSSISEQLRKCWQDSDKHISDGGAFFLGSELLRHAIGAFSGGARKDLMREDSKPIHDELQKLEKRRAIAEEKRKALRTLPNGSTE